VQGEQLPPERIAVINRGDGQLEWSVHCEHEWVTLERDEYGLRLYLRPEHTRANRANIHIRDDHTGDIKTVRVIVRFAPSTASSSLIVDRRELDQVPISVARVEPTLVAEAQAFRSVPSAPSGPSWRWKLLQSLWLLSTLLIGLTTWVGFLYVGLRAKQRKWLWASLAYGVAATIIFTFFTLAPNDPDGAADSTSWQANVGGTVALISWIGGVIHGLIVNVEWLKRREARSGLPT
jgi:hypothetical protein